jgi:hypothetical protein
VRYGYLMHGLREGARASFLSYVTWELTERLICNEDTAKIPYQSRHRTGPQLQVSLSRNLLRLDDIWLDRASDFFQNP